jgi:hypothetical protein
MGANYDILTLANYEKFAHIVHMFNNTINRNTKLTPTEMAIYPELEWAWIRYCRKHNKKIQQKLPLHYTTGNILLVHFDESKTGKKFDKHARQYRDLCEFLFYDNKLAVVLPLDSEESLTVPLYDTVKIANSWTTLPEKYKKLSIWTPDD